MKPISNYSDFKKYKKLEEVNESFWGALKGLFTKSYEIKNKYFATALEKLTNKLCPLGLADKEIKNKILQLADEFCNDNAERYIERLRKAQKEDAKDSSDTNVFSLEDTKDNSRFGLITDELLSQKFNAIRESMNILGKKVTSTTVEEAADWIQLVLHATTIGMANNAKEEGTLTDEQWAAIEKEEEEAAEASSKQIQQSLDSFSKEISSNKSESFVDLDQIQVVLKQKPDTYLNAAKAKDTFDDLFDNKLKKAFDPNKVTDSDHTQKSFVCYMLSTAMNNNTIKSTQKQLASDDNIKDKLLLAYQAAAVTFSKMADAANKFDKDPFENFTQGKNNTPLGSFYLMIVNTGKANASNLAKVLVATVKSTKGMKPADKKKANDAINNIIDNISGK